MHISVTAEILRQILCAQVQLFDPRITAARIEPALQAALERYEECARHIALPGYSRDGTPYLNHLHGDQSAMLLYFCANSAWRAGDVHTAEAFFILNKARNGLVCMYDTVLPDVFLLNHTVGTVLGKAAYAPFFVAYHRVTVGTDAGRQPVFGSGVVLYPGSSVIGESIIGDRVTVSAGTGVRNLRVPPDSVVTAGNPQAIVHERKRDVLSRYFG